MKRKIARMFYALSTRIDEATTLHEAERNFKSRGFDVFEVQTVANVDYVRCQNTRAWRRIGK